jgi:hypothetical protein
MSDSAAQIAAARRIVREGLFTPANLAHGLGVAVGRRARPATSVPLFPIRAMTEKGTAKARFPAFTGMQLVKIL